mmetsp:Transcript_9634/g.31841  ORF Transcript_9634/g.31841 Transcript_9634/m.31841 type:complete len:231 (+) Transcript_9634:396-1088(+)
MAAWHRLQGGWVGGPAKTHSPPGRSSAWIERRESAAPGTQSRKKLVTTASLPRSASSPDGDSCRKSPLRSSSDTRGSAAGAMSGAARAAVRAAACRLDRGSSRKGWKARRSSSAHCRKKFAAESCASDASKPVTRAPGSPDAIVHASLAWPQPNTSTSPPGGTPAPLASPSPRSSLSTSARRCPVCAAPPAVQSLAMCLQTEPRCSYSSSAVPASGSSHGHTTERRRSAP